MVTRDKDEGGIRSVYSKNMVLLTSLTWRLLKTLIHLGHISFLQSMSGKSRWLTPLSFGRLSLKDGKYATVAYYGTLVRILILISGPQNRFTTQIPLGNPYMDLLVRMTKVLSLKTLLKLISGISLVFTSICPPIS